MARQQNTQSAAQDVQSLFDPRGYRSVVRTWASLNERLTGVLVETGNRSTDIASATTKEALSNLRELAQVRDEPTEYGQAYTEFLQKQMELATRTAQSFVEVGQQAGSETTELATQSGQELADKSVANAKGAANRAESAAGKAA